VRRAAHPSTSPASRLVGVAPHEDTPADRGKRLSRSSVGRKAAESCVGRPRRGSSCRGARSVASSRSQPCQSALYPVLGFGRLGGAASVELAVSCVGAHVPTPFQKSYPVTACSSSWLVPAEQIGHAHRPCVWRSSRPALPAC